jgi:hypothetical protein
MTLKKFAIKELAKYFDLELQRYLPILILPDNELSYKKYIIRQLPNENWGVINSLNFDIIEEYFLKSCALMGVKYYDANNLRQCSIIKDLDRLYWNRHIDTIIFNHSLSVTKDKIKRDILANKLENSELAANHYQNRISNMLRWTFA